MERKYNISFDLWQKIFFSFHPIAINQNFREIFELVIPFAMFSYKIVNKHIIRDTFLNVTGKFIYIIRAIFYQIMSQYYVCTFF